MTNFLTQETPGKVMALLGASLFSMAFLFAVTISNSSMDKVYNPIPDPFSAGKVVAFLDNTSKSYSDFLAVNLFNPEKQSVALAADNINYIGDSLSDSMLAFVGGPQALLPEPVYTPVRPLVAGAYTSVPDTR
jgi:hypothetical protein